MSSHQSTIATKVCTKCQRELPATAEYFYRSSSGRQKFRPQCRDCTKSPERREKDRIRQAERRKADPEGTRVRGRIYYHKNIEKERATKRRSTKKHSKKIYEYQKTWRNKNRDKVRASNNAQYAIHRMHIQKRSKAYRDNNKEKCLAIAREIARRNYYKDIDKAREKGRIAVLKRETRKKALPHLWSEEIWNWCLEYWDYACAYCGKEASVEIALAMEHVIALKESDCPGTVPWNMVPACHGLGGCNVRKGRKLVRQFLEEAFGVEAAEQKLHALEAFFALARRLYPCQELSGGLS